MPSTFGLKWILLLSLSLFALLLVLLGKSPVLLRAAVSQSDVTQPAKPPLNGKTSRRKTDIDRESRRTVLLADLEKTRGDDYEKVSEIYRELAKLFSERADYKEQFDIFWELNVARKEKIVIANVKAEELARMRSLGLVWSYRETADEMTGGLIRQAVVSSVNQITFDFPYQGPQRGHLTIRHDLRRGLAVIVQIERGQFVPCGLDDCTVDVRFDDGALKQFSISAPESSETTVRFIHDADRFLNELRGASKLAVEATFFQEGTQALKFNIADLKWD